MTPKTGLKKRTLFNIQDEHTIWCMCLINFVFYLMRVILLSKVLYSFNMYSESGQENANVQLKLEAQLVQIHNYSTTLLAARFQGNALERKAVEIGQLKGRRSPHRCKNKMTPKNERLKKIEGNKKVLFMCVGENRSIFNYEKSRTWSSGKFMYEYRYIMSLLDTMTVHCSRGRCHYG